jgi:hypothetical protein
MKKFLCILAITASAITLGMDNAEKPSVYTAPDNMGLLGTFATLYNKAEVIGMGTMAPNSGKPFENSTETKQVFLAACPNKYCDYVRGKLMKIDFSKYPEIETTQYNRQYGAHAAENILNQSHENTAPCASIISRPITDNPCSMFTPELVSSMDDSVRSELSDMIDQCERKAQSAKIIPANKLPKVKHCRAFFAFVSPPVNYIKHDDMPCEEAAQFMGRIEKSNKERGKPGNTSIKDMKICGKNGSWGRKKCHTFDLLDIADAQRIINQMDGDIK